MWARSSLRVNSITVGRYHDRSARWPVTLRPQLENETSDGTQLTFPF